MDALSTCSGSASRLAVKRRPDTDFQRPWHRLRVFDPLQHRARKGSEWVSTGTIMPDALATMEPRIDGRCVCAAATVADTIECPACGARAFHDFQSINPMGFSAAGRLWTFVVHPTAQGFHIKTWLKVIGTKGKARSVKSPGDPRVP